MTLRITTASDLLALTIPARQYLLHPWLPEGGLAFIYARAGVGKTHLGLAVAKAVACGHDLLGWKAGEPRRVLYVDGEMHRAELQARVRTVLGGAQPDGLSFASADLQARDMPSLSTPEGQAEFVKAAKDFDLVIFDNLACLTSSGDENDIVIWRTIQRLFFDLKRQGKSVILFHHAGKGGDQRGTSAREDAMDAIIRLEQAEDRDPTDGASFELHFTKHRGFFGADAASFVATLDPNTGLFVRSPLPKTAEEARMIALHAEGKSMREIGVILGVSHTTVVRRLAAAKARDELVHGADAMELHHAPPAPLQASLDVPQAPTTTVHKDDVA
jgi:DNA-binding CsgD family transcriptional regulator